MRVLSLPGLFRDRDESIYVARQLVTVFGAEMKRAGFTLLGTIGMGAEIIFARAPIRDMAELRGARIWVWDANEMAIVDGQALGMRLVPLPILSASHAYDDGRIDGFLSYPGGALVFQWSVQARYLIDLPVRYVNACIVVADRALDRLSPAERQRLREVFVDFDGRLEASMRGQDEMLLGGLFARQGIRPVAVDPAFRAEFDAAAAKARQQIGEAGVSRALLDRVLTLVQAYRSAHAAR
jgi:TRAP-type C4-dicarboxylate transport system substrate-binding protein